jgi:hypothetical protein
VKIQRLAHLASMSEITAITRIAGQLVRAQRVCAQCCAGRAAAFALTRNRTRRERTFWVLVETLLDCFQFTVR